jgi:hypothetical protein
MKTNAIKLIVAWAIVGSALGWGVYHSVKKSMPLFKGSTAAPSKP